jgi:ATP-dependent RNA helicase UAP56/SUB2
MSAPAPDIEEYESDSGDEIVDEADGRQNGDEKGHIGTAANFKDFLLKPEILKAIQDSGFEHPSKVQEEAIPMAMMGHDCVVQAKSGMGKTLVFCSAILNRLDLSKNAGLQALVLVHTRDMVHQIASDFGRFSAHMSGEDGTVRVQMVIGGVDKRNQRAALKENNPHIIVASPGRMAELVGDDAIDLSGITMLAIDEVDCMLEKSDMREQVQKIFLKTPRKKQTMVLSATLAEDIKPTVMKFVRNPKEILLEPDKLTLHGLKQFYCKVDDNKKNRKLIALLDSLKFNQVMVFVSSTRRADALNQILNDQEFPSTTLHGKMDVESRKETFKNFKKGLDKRIMVTTDVCARGVDMEKVNIVFNYDFPDAKRADEKPQLTPEEVAADTYLHRVGRAGRFGNRGLAISFIQSEEDQKIFDIVQSRFKVQIEELPETIDPSAHMPRPGEREMFEE